MGRFERKIQKRLKKETEEFDVWFERNKEHFPGFVNSESEEETEKQGMVKLKKKKLWIIPTAFVIVIFCVFLCFLPTILKKNAITTPSFFGDEAVIETNLSEEEYQRILQENSFINKMNVTLARKIEKTDDGSFVFAILNSELETENDYYLVTVQIEYNPYYKFVSKTEYDNFEKTLNINSFDISYRLAGFDSDDLYWYYMLTEKDGQRIYWEVHCFEESIEEFVQIIFSE